MAEIKVQIGAETKEFHSKLAKALKGFDDLKLKEKELAKAFKEGKISSDKYYKSIADNSVKLKQSASNVTKYKVALDNTGKGFDRLKKGATSGDSAMTAFSRTVQDAPFGMMGVSNNITNLTEQFGYLKTKTGSASTALKAMMGSLAGFGGITLAISAATSLWLVYGKEITKIVKSNNALVNSQKAVKAALKDFYGGQISKINTYVSILEDANTSETERKNLTNMII